MAEPVGPGHFKLGGAGKAEAHKHQTGHKAHADDGGCHDGKGLVAQFIQHQNGENEAHTGTEAVKIQGQGVQARGLDLGAFRGVTGGAAQIHGAYREQQQKQHEKCGNQVPVLPQKLEQRHFPVPGQDVGIDRHGYGVHRGGAVQHIVVIKVLFGFIPDLIEITLFAVGEHGVFSACFHRNDLDGRAIGGSIF